MSVAGLRRAGMVDMEANTTLVQQFPAHVAVADLPGPAPSVLVFHDVSGLTPEVCARANRLAREGFLVLAPNLYAHPFSAAAGAPPWMACPAAGEEGWSGFPVRSYFGPAESSEARAFAAGLPAERVREITDRALGYLALAADADPGRVAFAGFGIGGRFAFRAACALGDRVRALVAWSPTGIAARYPLRPAETMPILEYETLRAPVLLMYGAQDAEARPEEREAVERVLADAGVPHEIAAFPGTGHGFFDDTSPDFRVSAAREAWDRAVAFLRERLGGTRGPGIDAGSPRHSPR